MNSLTRRDFSGSPRFSRGLSAHWEKFLGVPTFYASSSDSSVRGPGGFEGTTAPRARAARFANRIRTGARRGGRGIVRSEIAAEAPPGGMG